AACGFRVLGGRAIRVDMLDRLAARARKAGADGLFQPDAEMLSLVGCSRDEIGPILRGLGYRHREEGDASGYRFAGHRRSRPAARRGHRGSQESPFAGLAKMLVAER